tara:strand:+ start:422 stop:589 length:168 start_codon:yes stop_codon:yes gene_type:complete
MKPFGLLEEAKELCPQRFNDADVLDKGVDNIPGLLRKEWYKEFTIEELHAINRQW